MHAYIESTKPFHTALSEAIKARDITFEALAEASGRSASYLNRLANGKMSPPSKAAMERIAAALRLSPMYFMEYRAIVFHEEALRNPVLLHEAMGLMEEHLRKKKVGE